MDRIHCINTNALENIQDMIDRNLLHEGTRVFLSFSNFNIDNSDYIPGFSISIEETKKIISLVHSHGGKISLSIGGPNHMVTGCDLYHIIGLLGMHISRLLGIYGFDGVDFNIQDKAESIPSDFSFNFAYLINMMRHWNPDLYITLTMLGSSWEEGSYQKSLLDQSIKSLDAYYSIEHDLTDKNELFSKEKSDSV